MSEGDRFSTRGYIWLGLLALAVLVGGFGGWAAVSQIAGAIVGSGQVEVDQNRQIIQHPDGGVVSELLVKEGDRVEAGQILIRLDPALLASQLSIVESQLFELKARRGRLRAERAQADTVTFDDDLLAAAAERDEVAELVEGQRQLFTARRVTAAKEQEQLRNQIEQIQSQIRGIEAQRVALDDQLALIQEEMTDQQSLLDRGLAQASRVLALRREAAGLAGELGELDASLGSAAERITEIELAILKLQTDRQEQAITETRDLQYTELELAEQRLSLREQLSRLDLRAPVSGVVYGLEIFTTRAVVQAAEPVMYIVPQDRPLVITARIEPIHVDQVFAGQEVVLRFPTFSARTTPELNGAVLQVSPDAFTDERTQAPYYRAEITLPEEEIARLPEGLTLIPGMPVETYMRTGDRTPLAYLVKPLADYFNRAFRES